MTTSDFLSRIFGQASGALLQLSPEQRSAAARAAIPDLHFFFDEGRKFPEREAPARTRDLAQSLYDALHGLPEGEATAKTLRERIVTDAFLRSEADKDQNVYLGKLFTRTLTNAVPDVIFLPASLVEAACAMRWCRAQNVPVTLRGAASTAMGGAVPNEGGLTLDLSRLDEIRVDAADGVCVVGAGARLRTIHQKLAERGLALTVYPSNLGGTLAGWFATGGIGMNAFGRGVALDAVRAADVILPAGEHVRFHEDGRMEVPGEGKHRRALGVTETAGWLDAHGYAPIKLADLAGSEGAFGLLLQLTVRVEKRAEIGAFLLAFELRDQALDAAGWVAKEAGSRYPKPANVKYLSGSHLHHVRKVWSDEDSREWRHEQSKLTDGAMLPWKRIAGPAELGATIAADRAHSDGYLFVDFLSIADARKFAAALMSMPGSPIVLGDDSVRFAAERFKPQQTKRLGPGMLAAEIVMPAAEVKRFLPRAEALAKNAGNELDAEVYYLANGEALVIGGYLTDHRSGAFAVDLMIAPTLTDLAMANHRGRPYVLGRWQSAWLVKRFGADGAKRRTIIKSSLDPAAIVNRGVLLGLRLRGALGSFVAATFAPGVTLLRIVYSSILLSFVARIVRVLLRLVPGPARGRGEPAEPGAQFHVTPIRAQGEAPSTNSHGETQVAAARALNCVNCGECNSVCPIFADSKIRLPQMLTHLGEAAYAGQAMTASGAALLDLCMRCGNCEEVCQAGIPHLPMYEAMQGRANQRPGYQRERHAAALVAIRGSTRYTRDFLDIRPGAYQKRTPASLTGTPRYLLLRAEGDAGPAATCIHCGACVAVCPTHANREFEGADPRWITTDQTRCIGCGTCVEVCPANLLNGGQTLRVMEAPTASWFVAIEDFEKQETP